VRVEDDDGIHQLKFLSEVDLAGETTQSASPWQFFHDSVQYVFPVTNQWHPELDIRLEPGETSIITVELDPYHAIKELKPSDNTMTRSLTCPSQ
jgi:hypothetical protein